jgi:hypothetical protein
VAGVTRFVRNSVAGAASAAFALLALTSAVSAQVPGRGGDPAFVVEIAEAAALLDATTPMTVDPITTLTNVSSRGTEVIYDMAIDPVIPRDQLEALHFAAQAHNQRNLCADADAGNLIRMGASMRHRYSDDQGPLFETLITTCPPAPLPIT